MKPAAKEMARPYVIRCRSSILSIMLLLVALVVVSADDYFTDFENQMLNEKSRQATTKLGNDFMTSVDSPKEIEILCPGSPIISIRDLVTDTATAFEGGECLVVKLKGDNFSFRLSLNCEETEKSEFNFDGDS